MALYNLDKDYEQEIAELFEKLSEFEFDEINAIAICMVVNDGDVVVAHNTENLRDMILMASYLKMAANSRYHSIRHEEVPKADDEECDYQSDIGLTD